MDSETDFDSVYGGPIPSPLVKERSFMNCYYAEVWVFDNEEYVDTIAFNARDYSNAMERIQEVYKENLLGIKALYEGPPECNGVFYISKGQKEKFLDLNGFYIPENIEEGEK